MRAAHTRSPAHASTGPVSGPVRRRIAIRPPPPSTLRVTTLFLLAPLFLILEVVQLVLSERYLGIKQIARSADPRSLGLGEVTAFFWSTTILGYWLWMLMLLLTPLSRVYALSLIVISATGFSLRRGSRMKWTLVILTFEGALRIGCLIGLCALVWRRL